MSAVRCQMSGVRFQMSESVFTIALLVNGVRIAGKPSIVFPEPNLVNDN